MEAGELESFAAGVGYWSFGARGFFKGGRGGALRLRPALTNAFSVQPAGVGADQKVVNFEQISIRKRAHAPLDRGDVFLEVGRQFDLNIHGDRS
jgi:hypothetical protein